MTHFYYLFLQLKIHYETTLYLSQKTQIIVVYRLDYGGNQHLL
jgi:hypothetical protein